MEPSDPQSICQWFVHQNFMCIRWPTTIVHVSRHVAILHHRKSSNQYNYYKGAS